MVSTHDLLIEIGTEELPPKALFRLAESFANNIKEALAKANFIYTNVKFFATPRRLAVLVSELAACQPDMAVERRGPALAAAFNKEGMATAAAQGFAKSCGVEVDRLERLQTDKGAWLVFRTVQKGQSVQQLLPQFVEQALAALPIPKRMRWGTSAAEFVRPVHWIVLLYGDDVIEAEILGIQTSNMTRGHRFHCPQAIRLESPAQYLTKLETAGKVIADFAVRKEIIRSRVREAARSTGNEPAIDESLLDEVTALVEWPVALLGEFDAGFLQVPQQALISTMKANQKYFHVVNERGQLQPYFITVANIESRDPHTVMAGNQRVLRARLEDAKFFFEKDLECRLDSHSEALKSVTFHAKLGSLYDKTSRVTRLAKLVAAHLSADTHVRASAERAGRLAKCDLLTNMVGEFPELQGLMGAEYARRAPNNEEDAVATALDEQYLPRFAGDRVPATPVGQALAIAERIDTLVGIFGIGELPTGEKDPFALRRAALGVVRTIIENQLDLDMVELLQEAVAGFNVPFKDEQLIDRLYDFIMERLRAYYIDTGVKPDVFEAVLTRRPARPYDFSRRVIAVTQFKDLPEAAVLAAAHKRIHNLLRQAQVASSVTIAPELLTEPAEKVLAQHIKNLTAEVAPLLKTHDYTQTLKRLSALREPVDNFFDSVMVMVDDEAIRNNRLALLRSMSEIFLEVADLSYLQS